jgi:hypothetical protein
MASTQSRRRTVDLDDAGLCPGSEVRGQRQRIGADAGGEAVAGVVDGSEAGLVVGHLQHRRHGPEDLLRHGVIIKGKIGEHGGGEEAPGVRAAVVRFVQNGGAVQQGGAAFDGGTHRRPVLRELLAAHHGTQAAASSVSAARNASRTPGVT